MFRFLISILFFSVFTFSFAQQVKRSGAKPPYRYIYKVTKAQAWKINEEKFKEVYTKEFLRTAVDSITVYDDIPVKYRKGGFILLTPTENNLYTEFIGSNAISVEIIQSPLEVGIVVRNTIKQSLTGIQFYTNENNVELNNNGYYYVVPKELYGKPLMVEYKDEFILIDVFGTKNKKHFEKKLDERWGNAGFVLIDKPKYHIKDTVFVKGYFTPSLFSKKASLKISYKDVKGKQREVFSKRICKDKNGSYTSYFVLPDTLPIDLNYSVDLSKKSRTRSASFRIEDYYLDDFLLDAEVEFDELQQDSMIIYVTYTTPQGDAINNGWIYFTIKPNSIKLAEVKDAYVPYVILKDSIQATGQTRYAYISNMPELPKGKYSMGLTVQVNSNGLTEEIKKEFSYSLQPVVMTHTIQGRVVEFKPYAENVPIKTGLALYEKSSGADTIAVTFPYRLDLQENRLPTKFIVDGNYIYVKKQEIIIQPIEFSCALQQKKIAVQIGNPFQFTLQIKDEKGILLYKNSEPIISIALPLEKNQMLYCDYVYLGEYFQKRFLISPDYKSLVIDAAITDTINPGAGIEAKVHVADVAGKSLRNVNLTALAVDDRLQHKGIPKPNELIQYDYDILTKQNSNYIGYKVVRDTSIIKNIYKDYNQFLYGDSINYFLIPEVNDSLTEAFLYVFKNKTYIRPGYVFEDGKPVYWADVNRSSVQSFYTTAGYHNYEIRLPDETIFIDSVFIFPSFKNNILIPIERIPANRYRSVSRPKRLTSDEINTLSPYLYVVNTSENLTLETKVNYYPSLYQMTHIINADSNFYVSSDFTNISITKEKPSVKKNRFTYLERQRFQHLKAKNSEISMSELKTFERTDKVVKTNAPDWQPITVSVNESNSYASLHVQYQSSDRMILKIIDPANVEQMESISGAYYSRYQKYIVQPGEYTIQIFDHKDVLLKEKKIRIEASGYYITDMYTVSITRTEQDDISTKKYSEKNVYYPNATMYYKKVYGPYSRSRNRRGHKFNYWGVYTGLNALYTGSSKLNYGYQFGALAGHQFSRHVRAEARFSYGKTALDMQQPYNYSYGKVGVMAWYSLFNYSRSTFNILLGTGMNGQYIIDQSVKGSALTIPVGVSLKYQLPIRYTESINLEVLWNKTLSGTDYSYLNQGIWEINLRFNFRFPSQARVICPSNFWGSETTSTGKSKSLLYKSETSVKTQSVTYSNVATADSVLNYNKPVANASNVSYELVRSNFYDRAYWIPSFKTDTGGNATFRATYPDALTHWNNYIIAHKGRRSNTWESQTTTYLSDYVQLYVPRFVIGGDSASATYRVQSDEVFSIQNNVDGIRAGESTSPDGTYAFYVQESADTMRCTSVLFIDNKQVDGEQRLIPVYGAGNETYTGTYQYLTGDTLLNVHKPDSAIETKLYLSNNLQDFVRMQYQQLMDYSYSCNEQTASKLIGTIAGKELNGSYHGKNPQSFYSKLKININRENMYGWWGSSISNISMSAYVYYALKLYYKHAGISPDRFYTHFETSLIENAYYHKVNYFTYWLIRESGLPMKIVELEAAEPRTYKEEILKLRIRQLEGDTIKRSEIEKYIGQTILGNAVLQTSSQFQTAWHDHELMYLILLHKIAKKDFPDIAVNIRKGLIEHGSLSEYTPTYVKALFINEFYELNTEQKNTAVVTYDNVVTNGLPFTKFVRDSLNHTLSVKDASGIYIVKSEKQIRTTSTRHAGLEIDYVFKENGKTVTSLQSGTVAEQVVTLKVSSSCSYVMVEIPLAAGCMLEDVLTAYPRLLSHREVFRDKVILYFDVLPQGTYTFTIREKVLFKGNYQLNPCSVNLMYFPMIQTQTALRRIKIN